jgi:hypothetical protein
MHIKQTLLVVGLGLAAFSAQADESFNERFQYAPSDSGYMANQFNFDIFGSYASRGRSGEADGKLGIGGGVGYFITRNVGVDVHTYADAFKTPYNINFSGIYRYPIESTAFAPYAFGGVGRQWDYAAQWLFHLGLGSEFRVNRYTGIFVDWRRVFALETHDYHLVRLGVRFGF